MGVDRFSAHRTLRPGVARVEARLLDFAYPLHSHDHVVIGLVRGGALSSRYGQPRYTVSAGQVLTVNPGQVHDGRSAGARGRRTSMLEIDVAAYRDLCREALGRPWLEFTAPVSQPPMLARALARWLLSLGGDDPGAEREAATAFLGLLPAAGEAPGPALVEGELAARVRRRLREGPPGGDGVGGIAAELGVSRFRLLRAFKRAYGLTPEDFRRQLRVERARARMLRPGGLADVACAAGFADQSHMTREFHRLLGLTPAAYRRALR